MIVVGSEVGSEVAWAAEADSGEVIVEGSEVEADLVIEADSAEEAGSEEAFRVHREVAEVGLDHRETETVTAEEGEEVSAVVEGDTEVEDSGTCHFSSRHSLFSPPSLLLLMIAALCSWGV